jgi:hypothetical protein
MKDAILYATLTGAALRACSQSPFLIRRFAVERGRRN